MLERSRLGRPRTVLRLGDVLVGKGYVGPNDIEDALAEQRVSGQRLGDILVARELITEAQLYRVLAEQFAISFVDLEDHVADPVAGRVIREPFARRLSAIGIGWDDDRLVVAMANPGDVFALDDIRMIAGTEIVPIMAAPGQIHGLIDRIHRSGQEAESTLQEAKDEYEEAEGPESAFGPGAHGDDDVDDAPVVRFVNELISRAVHDGASDLHIEPTKTELRIRLRIDGVLHDVMRVPRPLQSRVVSRVKILASMNIADRRAPQDGRASFTIDGRRVDVRVVSFPTTNGEALVIRILDKSQSSIEIKKLGFLPDTLSRFEECYRQSSGAILVTGPTGSGKSTTMYAALSELNAPDRNIITIEDPVEYELDGIKQVQVEPKAGMTFASALRSLLRADPDIIMVGEIRDAETAKLATDAALTGHLVLSSLHTKSAAATPARLVKMGVEPFLVTSAVQCVVAQRLARRLCDKCREPQWVPWDELVKFGWTEADAAVGHLGFFRPVGCKACAGTGYRGRFALQEVMRISDPVAEAICEWAPPAVVEQISVSEGMTTLMRDGLLKAAEGLTSLEELHRVAS